METADNHSLVTRRAWQTRTGWIAFAVAIMACFVVGALHIEWETVSDPRLVNPDPAPRPYEPVLGVANWPMVSNALSVLLTIGIVGVCTWLSIRQRRLHWVAILALAILFTGFVDPVANWATFTVFDPRVAHFPATWPWMRLSPLLEPAGSFLGGYASYYLFLGLLLYGIHSRLVAPCFRPTSWVGRHPLAAMLVATALLSIPINGYVQFQWLYIRLFVYVEAVGPILTIGHAKLPVLMAVYDALLFATIATLCAHDEDGRSIMLSAVAKRLPLRSGCRLTSARLLAAAFVVLFPAYLIPVGVMSTLRVAGFAHPSYDVWPYPEVRVYDPYGDVERSGRPGPFHR